MIELRKKENLGKAHHGWLDTHYHFSFSSYYKPSRVHWGALRVWNNDTIEPNTGFPTHPHDNMEIITYVYKGAITHKDSMGNVGRTNAGEVQIMSAGTGVTHSEYNLESEQTELFQIWIMPNEKNATPNWGTKSFPKHEHEGKFTVMASGDDADSEALKLNANGKVLATHLDKGQTLDYTLTNKYAYLVAARGHYEINEIVANQGDGVAIKDEKTIKIKAIEETEIVMVLTL